MKSPFPGMDPYVESRVHWPDFHGRFVNALSETIADTLPPAYFARIQEDVLLLAPEPGTDEFKAVPDVLVAKDPAGVRAAGPPRERHATQTLEPATLANVFDLDPHVEYFIEIVRMPEAEVVTVVEVLSPANKTGGGAWPVYGKADPAGPRGPGELVGDRPAARGPKGPAGQPDAGRGLSRARQPGGPPTAVRRVLVGRARAAPTIPVPLRPPAPDASADLARTFAMAYERGRYGRRIRYADSPPPPDFSETDAGWVAETARAGAKPS